MEIKKAIEKINKTKIYFFLKTQIDKHLVIKEKNKKWKINNNQYHRDSKHYRRVTWTDMLTNRTA